MIELTVRMLPTNIQVALEFGYSLHAIKSCLGTQYNMPARVLVDLLWQLDDGGRNIEHDYPFAIYKRYSRNDSELILLENEFRQIQLVTRDSYHPPQKQQQQTETRQAR